jgi:hypothetical protein
MKLILRPRGRILVPAQQKSQTADFMNKRIRPLLFSVLCVFAASSVVASSMLPSSLQRQIDLSAGVFRGNVTSLEPFLGADNHIYTLANVRVDETFKGTLPASLTLTLRGGSIAGRGELDGFSPVLVAGEEVLLFVARRTDGTFFPTSGVASALPVSTTKTAAAFASLDTTVGDNLLGQIRALVVGGVISGGDLTDNTVTAYWTVPSPPPGPKPTPLTPPTVTATNLLAGSDGVPARFILPDRAEPIPYLIDADFLPAGITQTQAVAAVQSALAAWTAVTSLKYQFMGIQSFGQASPNIVNEDGYLRIQLHDHYNYIGSGSGSGDTLGVGGHSWINPILSSGWCSGGNVHGSDFHKTVNGYLVLAHTNVVMQTLSTFTEVLCHEIGHTFGMAHSSQNAGETNNFLRQAIMFFQVHADGRGATLGAYDPPVARQVHPTNGTPPYNYDRYIDSVTTGVPTNIPNINYAQLRGYSLGNIPLTVATTDATTLSGAFSASGTNLTYTPAAFWADASTTKGDGSYFDIIYARFSDGTNASPFLQVIISSFGADSYFEGIPDSWRQTYFGNADPTVGLKHHAADDADGDKVSNIQEFLNGSDPTVKTSNLHITSFSSTNIQWQAKPYEVYEVHGSTNLSNWVRVINPIVPTNTVASATGFTNSGAKQYFRVLRVP